MAACGLFFKSPFVLLLFLWFFNLIGDILGHGDVPKLLFISMDGFRYDHIDYYNLTNLKRMGERGVRAERLQSSYITKTFPNHATLVTGLYEESHGIIANNMVDPKNFSITWHGCSTYGPNYPDCGKWYHGEPIWATNARSDQPNPHDRIAASVYYPGSNVPWAQPNTEPPVFHIDYPLDWKSLETFRTSIDKMINWMANCPSINLGLMYHYQPDATEHQYGPRSIETEKVLRQIDADLGYLWQKLNAVGLGDSVNVIVTSDHGFANITDHIALKECLTSDLMNKVEIVDNTPLLHLYVKPDVAKTDKDRRDVIKSIHEVLQFNANDGRCVGIKFYSKEKIESITQIPDRYHYRNNIHIPDILLEAPLGAALHKDTGSKDTQKGTHGWNNSYPEMGAIFLAKGPAFKQGYVHKPFNNIDVYELMCAVLGLSPAPNNGSLYRVKDMLTPEASGESDSDSSLNIIMIMLACIVCSTLGGLFILSVCQMGRARARSRTNYHLAEGGKVNGGNSTGSSVGQVNEISSLLKDESDDEF